MLDFYNHFYAAVEQSAAHRLFCTRVFGCDLSQHGFADVAQLELVIDAAAIGPGVRVLDVGCGNGRIAEYIATHTSAAVTGLDYAPGAIEQAIQRTAGQPGPVGRMRFLVGDINDLHLDAAAFDVILSIDSVYFSDDYAATIACFKHALRPGGRLGFCYSYGREPWVAIEDFPADRLDPDRTPLAEALRANGLSYAVTDLTAEDYRLALLRAEVLDELRPQFAAEGNEFIYENRRGDAAGIRSAIELNLHRRYLYVTH